MKLITRKDTAERLTWQGTVDALIAGHRLPKAQIGDQFLTRSNDTLLSRAAWIDGLGFGVKSVSVMAGNTERGLPTVHGGMLVFDDATGQVEAMIDSDLVTQWKTAGDSVLGAHLLARKDVKHYLIVGAGVVAQSLARAYSAIFPGLEKIEIWNRTGSKARTLAQSLNAEKLLPDCLITASDDLQQSCQRADIISTATMSNTPVISGDWVSPGTHIDLIGAFRKDMREADDTLLKRGQLYVDSVDTTIEHIGELMIPIANGVITSNDVLADFYTMVQRLDAGQSPGRSSDDEITVFKNGGGAHLDLMTAKYILSQA